MSSCPVFPCLLTFHSSVSTEPLVHSPGEDFVYAIQFDVLGRLLEVRQSPLLRHSLS